VVVAGIVAVAHRSPFSWPSAAGGSSTAHETGGRSNPRSMWDGSPTAPCTRRPATSLERTVWRHPLGVGHRHPKYHRARPPGRYTKAQSEPGLGRVAAEVAASRRRPLVDTGGGPKT
jgi:hypothetical protein